MQLKHTHFIPLLSVCKVVSHSIVSLSQQSIVTVTRSDSQQLKHPEPVAQLDPQAYGQVPAEEHTRILSSNNWKKSLCSQQAGTCDPYPGTCAPLPQSCRSKLPPPPVSWARPSACPGVWWTECLGNLCNGRKPFPPSSDPVCAELLRPAAAWEVQSSNKKEKTEDSQRAGAPPTSITGTETASQRSLTFYCFEQTNASNSSHLRTIKNQKTNVIYLE